MNLTFGRASSVAHQRIASQSVVGRIRGEARFDPSPLARDNPEFEAANVVATMLRFSSTDTNPGHAE